MLTRQDDSSEASKHLQQVSIDDILELQREEQLVKQLDDDRKKKAMLERGLVPHTDPIQEEFL